MFSALRSIRETGRGLRTLASLANLGTPRGYMYRGATFFAAHVALDERLAERWLPPGLSLARPATATVFASHFPETTFGSVYDEAGIFFHVKRRLRRGVFCPWMVVTDDVALIVGRELLGYPKKLARVSFTYGSGSEGSEVHAEVERRGRVLLTMRGRIGEAVTDAPPMLGQRTLNVRGALAIGAQRLVTFTPRERILEARRASAEVLVERERDRQEQRERGNSADRRRDRDREEGRDPIAMMGLGAVLSAHFYRVDVGAGLPPREVRRAGLGFAMRSLGARWI